MPSEDPAPAPSNSTNPTATSNNPPLSETRPNTSSVAPAEATNSPASPETASISTPSATLSTSPTPDSQSTPTPAAKPTVPKLLKQWTFWAMSAFGIGCIFAIVLAVYAFSHSAVLQSDVDRLKAEVADKDQQISRYAAQLGQQVGSSSRPGYIDESKVEPKDHIYIGAWGIRFKIPDGFKDVSYLFRINLPERTDGEQTETLCVRGVPTNAAVVPQYMSKDLDDSTLGCLTRSKESGREASFQNGEYYFYYSRSNTVNSDKDEERLIITRAVSLTQELLTKNITNF